MNDDFLTSCWQKAVLPRVDDVRIVINPQLPEPAAQTSQSGAEKKHYLVPLY